VNLSVEGKRNKIYREGKPENLGLEGLGRESGTTRRRSDLTKKQRSKGRGERGQYLERISLRQTLRWKGGGAHLVVTTHGD